MAFTAPQPVDVRPRLEAFFAPRTEQVIAAYLFGSQATGKTHPRSDVDVGVLFREPPEPSLMGPQFTMQADLEDLLRAPVDLVVLNSAPVDLIHRVLRDGILCEHDPSRRIAFEVKARGEYLDLLPILKRYRRLNGRET